MVLGRTLAACGLLVAAAAAQEVQVDSPSDWTPVLESIGLRAVAHRADRRIVIGNDPAAEEAGILAGGSSVRVTSLVDEHDPGLEIVWQTPESIPVYELPKNVVVHTREKHTGAPLAAAVGGLLWLATEPGERGYERYPYLTQAIVSDAPAPAQPRLVSNRLWVFLDTSYRTRADPAYLARRWRRGGVAAVHIATWHFHEPDGSRDARLKKLIEACHREGILAYAWLELPHVSDQFWTRYPDCRERTASGADARLDWRKLVNLADPRCFDRAAGEIDALIQRFDWDGINLAELYFESLHGPSNPARFTPMNDWVRADAERTLKFDPIDLFDDECDDHWSRATEKWRKFADYRARLALDLQSRFVRRLAHVAPEADIVVTQIDDRFDTRMREYLGADTAALLPLANELDFTVAIEDPATIWNLGPQRYTELGRRYADLTEDHRRLAIDINIVERYQQVYPTRRQVGVELFQLVHAASEAFHRVLLYFEHSIGRADWPLLPHAAAIGEFDPATNTVTAAVPIGLRHPGPAIVDGYPWPIYDGETVWLPAGTHRVERAEVASQRSILSFTGELLGAHFDGNSIVLRYRSRSPAIARTNFAPTVISLDGKQFQPPMFDSEISRAILLPKGTHTARLSFDALVP